MKITLIVLLNLVLAFSAIAVDISEEFDVEEGALLDINLKHGGSIEIQGWDKDKAEVEVTFERCDPDDFKFEIEKTRDGIEIFSKQRYRINRASVYVRIMVPKKFDIDLHSAGGGITINDIIGEIRGKTGGGALTLSNLEGYIDLKTGGGSIELTDSKLDGSVVTGGGSVLVEDVSGDIDARSGGGAVTYRNVKTPDGDYPAEMVHIRNAGGRINVRHAPHGADVQTGGGDIDIRSAAEFVKAQTGGGNIYVDELDGWIKASTGAGDIEIALVGDQDDKKRDVSLWTGSGDVTLVIPENLSVEFDIELAYTKNYRGRAEIKSDFDLDEEESREWDYDHGSPRKIIFAESSNNGGQHRIKIRAVNGVVTLEKK